MGVPAHRIALIGLRRAGKSAVGRVIAAELGIPFVDTDEQVTLKTGRSPADWILAGALAAFREAERHELFRALEGPKAVIATGGGAVLAVESRERLRSDARVIYLRCDPCTLAARARAANEGDRPLLTGSDPTEEAMMLFADRDGIYRETAHAIVDAGAGLDEVALRVLARLRFFSGS